MTVEAEWSSPYITIEEVIRICGVSRSTVNRRIKDGTLKAYKIGPRLIRFDINEVYAAFKVTA